MKPGHVLVVSDGYALGSGPVGQRSHDLSNALRDSGWKVSVLTSTSAAIAADTLAAESATVALTDMTRAISATDDVNVVKVPVPTHPNDALVSRWPVARVKNATSWAEKDSLARESSWYGDELAMWRPRLEAAAVNIENAHHVDLVIGVVPHLSTLAVGALFHSLWGTPYAIDIAHHLQIAHHPDEWRWLTVNASYVWAYTVGDAAMQPTQSMVATATVERWTQQAASRELSAAARTISP